MNDVSFGKYLMSLPVLVAICEHAILAVPPEQEHFMVCHAAYFCAKCNKMVGTKFVCVNGRAVEAKWDTEDEG